jgi:hypothetical protein
VKKIILLLNLDRWFPNTELRSLSDSVFFDYITPGMTEKPHRRIDFEYRRSGYGAFKRTFLLEDGKSFIKIILQNLDYKLKLVHLIIQDCF